MEDFHDRLMARAATVRRVLWPAACMADRRSKSAIIASDDRVVRGLQGREPKVNIRYLFDGDKAVFKSQ